MPLMRPPPPTGTMKTVQSGASATNSSPQVPAPKVMCLASNGCITVSPSRAATSCIHANAVAISATSVTSAPCASHPAIRIGSAACGINIWARTPAARAAQETAMA